MESRPNYEIRFADGGVMSLGHATRVMGVVNLTPDSFSDGGAVEDPGAAVEIAARMVAEGADIVDVGGESTRPGAVEVPAEDESARVLPAIARIKAELEVRVSIDTRKADVARRALDAGADLVNDVSALGDPAMLGLVLERRVPVVLMHMRGSPETMNQYQQYDDLVGDVASFLRAAVSSAIEAGVGDGKILVDPGLGFAKSAAGNLSILRRLPALRRLGRPILIGASRKSFIGRILDLPVDDRLEGSLAVAAYASANGAHVIRVHDVAPTVRVVRMIDAIREA